MYGYVCHRGDVKRKLAFHCLMKGKYLNHTDGNVEVYEGQRLTRKYVRLCRSGLHASLNPFHALSHSEEYSHHLCLVEIGGEVQFGSTKCAASKRRCIKIVSIKRIIRELRKYGYVIPKTRKDQTPSSQLLSQLGDATCEGHISWEAWSAVITKFFKVKLERNFSLDVGYSRFEVRYLKEGEVVPEIPRAVK